MTTVACVLRTGGLVFDVGWVYALRAGIALHLPDAPFVCLTDHGPMAGIRTIPLRHAWKGWWAKLELFRDDLGIEGRVLYMDLDTVPVGPLDDLAAYTGPLAMLSDLLDPRFAASGVMLYEAGAETYLYRAVADAEEEPRFLFARYPRSDYYYREVMDPPALRIQDLFPGRVVSLKREGRRGPPDGASLVCGHGVPRLSQEAAGWAYHTFQERRQCGKALAGQQSGGSGSR